MSWLKKLRELRKEKNLTQQDLADYLNVSKYTISHWELGESFPPINFLYKLADIFECSIDYLVGRTDEIEVRSSEGHSLTKNESELLKLFNLLDEVRQNKVIGYCYALAN